MQHFRGKGGMQEITYEPLPRGRIVWFDRLTPEDGESGLLPAEQEIDDTWVDFFLGQQSLKDTVTEEMHHLFCIDPGDKMEIAVAGEGCVSSQTVEVGVKVDRKEGRSRSGVRIRRRESRRPNGGAEEV